jgi:anthranilate phosphoribosyltransferase
VTLPEGIDLATTAIDSGAAAATLERFVTESQAAAAESSAANAS